MEHFLSEWKEKTDKRDKSYQALAEAKDFLKEFFKEEGYDAKASFGMNQRSHVPWLCLSDPNLGKGASCGLYISYLFQADMEAVSISPYARDPVTGRTFSAAGRRSMPCLSWTAFPIACSMPSGTEGKGRGSI